MNTKIRKSAGGNYHLRMQVSQYVIIRTFGSTAKEAYRKADHRLRRMNRALNNTHQQPSPQLLPAPTCAICDDTGFRFSANFCTCEIGRQKLDETISAKSNLDEAKEAFHASRANADEQRGPKEKPGCFCQHGLVCDKLTGEAFPCLECAAGHSQDKAEENERDYYEAATNYQLRGKYTDYATA